MPKANPGFITAVQGTIVDIRFTDKIPALQALLLTGAKADVFLEVLSHLSVESVRAIALTPTGGLARGMKVYAVGASLMAPVGKTILARMFNVFGQPIDQLEPPQAVEWRSVYHAPPTRLVSCRRRCCLLLIIIRQNYCQLILIRYLLEFCFSNKTLTVR